MIETATFHIADIGTIEYLLQTAPKVASPKNLIAAIFHSIRKLCVTARLNLQVFKAIEGASEDLEAKTSAASWRRVWPAIASINSLRKLEVEIDHTDRASWSVAHERAIISPLVPLAALPQLKVVVILPNLHPFYERPDRHFTEDSVEPPFTICRRMRQIYHATENPGNEGRPLLVTQSCYDSFPILPAISMLPNKDGTTPSPEELKEVEEEERARWKSGEDVHLFISQLFYGEDCHICNGEG